MTEYEAATLAVQEATLGFQETALRIQEASLGIQKAALRIQEATLDIQKAALRIQEATLAVQKAALALRASALTVAKWQVAATLAIGIGQIAVVAFGIRAMTRAGERRAREQDQRHDESMTALRELIRRTAPAAD